MPVLVEGFFLDRVREMGLGADVVHTGNMPGVRWFATGSGAVKG